MYEVIKQNFRDIRFAYLNLETIFSKIVFLIRVVNHILLVIPLVILLGFVIGILHLTNPFKMSTTVLEKLCT